MMKEHIKRPLVYVAAPYSSNPVGNTHDAIRMAERFEQTGIIAAYPPHLNLLWDFLYQHDNDFWLDYDLAILMRCDALFRMPGLSDGSDGEVNFCEHNGIPVFYDEGELIAWAEHYVSDLR